MTDAYQACGFKINNITENSPIFIGGYWELFLMLNIMRLHASLLVKTTKSSQSEKNILSFQFIPFLGSVTLFIEPHYRKVQNVWHQKENISNSRMKNVEWKLLTISYVCMASETLSSPYSLLFTNAFSIFFRCEVLFAESMLLTLAIYSSDIVLISFDRSENNSNQINNDHHHHYNCHHWHCHYYPLACPLTT